MTIISYFLSHIETDSSALSKTEYYEMNETTHRERQNSLYIWEIRRCGGQNLSQKDIRNLPEFSCFIWPIYYGMLWLHPSGHKILTVL